MNTKQIMDGFICVMIPLIIFIGVVSLYVMYGYMMYSEFLDILPVVGIIDIVCGIMGMIFVMYSKRYDIPGFSFDPFGITSRIRGSPQE